MEVADIFDADADPTHAAFLIVGVGGVDRGAGAAACGLYVAQSPQRAHQHPAEQPDTAGERKAEPDPPMAFAP
ncbi:MAG: hypothetical protein ACE367_15570 [Acidimicrobiales bacterium]